MNFIVIALIAANILASLKGFKEQFFFNKYKFSVLSIQKGEQYRLFSSGFLHVDYFHLGFNMYALYLFSGTVLYSFSSVQFLLVYGVSLLAGNYLSLFVHKNDPYYSAVGASGAVTGIVYSSIVLFPDMKLYLLLIPIPIKGYFFGIAYLLYSIYGMRNQVGNVGHTAHIGGAVAGYLLTIVMQPSVFYQHPVEVLLMAIPIVILWGLHLKKA
ncbi:rhomboid family intramembrane serine protease [Ochrovirga pacifica]|uniref:rhomboid family intramembrane serine protease n=1 Tax=Ochrovirga pacifica TaxID=1042376 RepID=UPI0003118865|nr:rhomboid family intramembrane serine protease [Ochrovirga pacifica]